MTALGVCLFMIFACESGMALFAHKIKQRLSDNTVSYIKKGSGIVFLGIAGKLLWDLLFDNL
jgi:threonine/homoserine/homoserine lactone efflux protein